MFVSLALAMSVWFAPFTANTARTMHVYDDCETVGPRLDGSMVQICAGSVVAVWMHDAIVPATVTTVVVFDSE